MEGYQLKIQHVRRVGNTNVHDKVEYTPVFQNRAEVVRLKKRFKKESNYIIELSSSAGTLEPELVNMNIEREITLATAAAFFTHFTESVEAEKYWNVIFEYLDDEYCLRDDPEYQLALNEGKEYGSKKEENTAEGI